VVIITNEIMQVKQLGDNVGYGHIMMIASALWRKKLRDSGEPTCGAFVPRIDAMDDDDRLYDRLIEEALNDK